MDSDPNSPLQENNEPEPVFNKPSNDIAKRNHHRRRPISSSSSSDGSLRRERSDSPVSLKKDAKISSSQTKKDDKADARCSRSHHDHNSESFRYPSRSFHGSSRHDDHHRDGKRADEEDKYSRMPSRSSRDHRDSNRSDYRDRDADYKRSNDPYHNGDKYRYKESSSDRRHGKLSKEEENHDRDRSTRIREYLDEKRDYKSSRDYRTDRSASYGESRGSRGDAMSKRDNDGYHSKETYKDAPKGSSDDRKKGVEQDINMVKKHAGESGERLEKGSDLGDESMAKKPKLSGFDKDTSQGKDSKQGEELVAKVAVGQAHVSNSSIAADVDAAKVAAMRAAELVNKNLIGTGIMTADQKKKLLWGSKKANTLEEPSRRWDTALFSDRERQEKFNKLMGVKGEVKVEHQASDQDTEKQSQLQLDLEKQYTAGLRRRDGRTVGLGL